jgi:hypothetical protein
MIILDTLLIGGIKFVLQKIAETVQAQLDDVDVLREELLAAQMRFELGEIDEAEFAGIERAVLARLRELREQALDLAPGDGEIRVTGVEVAIEDGHDADR